MALLHLLIGLSVIYSAYSMSFLLTLPEGNTVMGDIDDLDQVQVGNVRGQFDNPQVITWARRHWYHILERHPELRSISVQKLTSRSESLDYLEDLIQENGIDVRAFVEDLFDQAGMHLEVFPHD